MNAYALKSVEIGRNELWEQREFLDAFVKVNFDVLYEGAVRLGFHIQRDYYAPLRISISYRDRGINGSSPETRLHEHIGLKYANGHKYNAHEAPTEDQLIQTVKDINRLLDSASQDIKSKVKITISELVK